MSIEQVNATNNQSTLKVTLEHMFLFDNRYNEGSYKNDTAGTVTLEPFSLVVRDTATADGLIPATAANLADVIGVSANENDIEQAAGASNLINYATQGTINETLLVLPAAVTLDTVVGNKVLRDVLEGLGFHLENSVENTKFDNV